MDFNEWAEKKRQSFHEIQADELNQTCEAKDLITRKVLVFESDDLTFTTSSKLLPKHYRKLSNLQKIQTDNLSIDDYDLLQKEMAEFMELISLEDEFDKQFWITFDENTGELKDAITAVIERLTKQSESVNAFRSQ